jgi:hypothetical protein
MFQPTAHRANIVRHDRGSVKHLRFIERENIMVTIEQRFGSDSDSYFAKQREEHGKHVAERARVNGQPNGYRPISEAELQARKASLHYAEMARVMDEELA